MMEKKGKERIKGNKTGPITPGASIPIRSSAISISFSNLFKHSSSAGLGLNKMEDHSSPLSWELCYYQDEVIEEMSQCIFYTAELQTAVSAAQEEVTKRELEILQLKDVLAKIIKERNEAQAQCQSMMLEKAVLQQQLLLQKQQQDQLQQQQQRETQQLKREVVSLSGTYSSEDESRGGDSSNNQPSSYDSNKFIANNAATQFCDPIHQQPLESLLPDEILKLAGEKPLPEKGKLLQAVKEAGPLLKTLLLAGPLPQWQHPPPQLDCVEIPPVTISSPTARLIQQESFNSVSPCLSKKRVLELPELGTDSSPPPNKYQKSALH